MIKKKKKVFNLLSDEKLQSKYEHFWQQSLKKSSSFPDFHVYTGPIRKNLREVLSTVHLGCLHFVFKGGQENAKVTLLNQKFI